MESGKRKSVEVFLYFELMTVPNQTAANRSAVCLQEKAREMVQIFRRSNCQ